MRNRPLHEWDGSPRADGWWDYARDVDRLPIVRLACVFLAILLPLGVIGYRVAYLQTQLPEVYAAEFTRTSERFEEIPAPNGRILSSEGDILAEDVREYTLSIYYQYLADEPNPAWVKQQVRARLSTADRRRKSVVERTTQEFLEEREAMWQRLTQLPGLDPEELHQAREAVASRMEVMRDKVLARQAATRQSRAAETTAEPVAAEHWSQRVWQPVVQALSTPPERGSTPPLILKEELEYHPVARKIPAEVARRLIVQAADFPGVLIDQTTRREYPAGDSAAHLIGYRRPLTQEEFDQRHAQYPSGDPLGYQVGEWVGRTGLEKHYERHLRGLNGKRKFVLNRRGQILSSEIVQHEQPGRDLELSLSAELQRSSEQLLDLALAGEQDASEKTETLLPTKPPQGGCIVVLDARTGEVVAAAAAPRFDVNLFVRNDASAWDRVQRDTRQPLFPRVTQMALPPGSVFKIVSATAFLSTGQIDPQREIQCLGYLHVPTKDRCLIFAHYGVGHGATDMTQALARSCNVYFYQGAEIIGGKELAHWARSFGLGRPTGIDLPGEKGGHVPLNPTSGRVTGWNPGDTRHLAIGQSTLAVTPIQIARMTATVANGGHLVTPRIARSLHLVTDDSAAAEATPGSGRTFLPPPAAQPLPGLPSPEVLQWVRKGMEAVVADSHGTGYKTVRLPEVTIAGKTGTAEAGGGRPDHAWFAGYVPADQPRYAFVVVLEHAGSGGKIAGPVARKLVQNMLQQGLIEAQGQQVTVRQ